MISTAHFTSPHECLGQRLRVPTVGQALLLEGFGVWPCVDTSQDLQQQFTDLILSVGVLTRSWQSYHEWIGGWFANRYHSKLWKRLGKSKGLSELKAFNHWAKTIHRLPAMVGTRQAESFKISVGPVGHLIVKLAMEFGWSEESIKNLSYPVAVWYGIGIDERLQLVQVQEDDQLAEFNRVMDDDEAFERIMKGGKG